MRIRSKMSDTGKGFRGKVKSFLKSTDVDKIKDDIADLQKLVERAERKFMVRPSSYLRCSPLILTIDISEDVH